jgi:hypothetical protein
MGLHATVFSLLTKYCCLPNRARRACRTNWMFRRLACFPVRSVTSSCPTSIRSNPAQVKPQPFVLCEIGGSHSTEYQEYNLVGYYVMCEFNRQVPTFWRNCCLDLQDSSAFLFSVTSQNMVILLSLFLQMSHLHIIITVPFFQISPPWLHNSLEPSCVWSPSSRQNNWQQIPPDHWY